MAIIKENKLLMLSGQRACSWLAAQKYFLGLDAPKIYKQQGGDQIIKLTQCLVAVSGAYLPQKIYELWDKELPGEVMCHVLTAEQTLYVEKFSSRVSVGR